MRFARFALRRFKYPCSVHCVTTTTSQRTVKQIGRTTAITWLRFESSKNLTAWCLFCFVWTGRLQWIFKAHADDAAMNHGLSTHRMAIHRQKKTDFTRLISFSDRGGMVQDHHLQIAHMPKKNKIGPICPSFLNERTLYDLIHHCGFIPNISMQTISYNDRILIWSLILSFNSKYTTQV